MARNKGPKKASSIPLMGKALTEVQAGFAAMKELQGKLDAFLGGYKAASGVPEGWVLDTKQMAFVAPPKKEKPE